MPWIKQENGLRYEGEPHWNDGELENLFLELTQTRQNKPETICELLSDSLKEKFVAKDTLWQFSKWCEWSNKKAEAVSRRIGDIIFGKYPQPRFWDQQNRPNPNAENQYQEWLKEIVTRSFSSSPKLSDQFGHEENVNALDTMIGLLRQFRQVILYGPPGTGKTRLARFAAHEILNGKQARITENSVRESLATFRIEGRFELVVFHPAYEYEQFIGGIAPLVGTHGIEYHVKFGPFFNLCCWVRNNKKPAVLVIDEINRGNLPKLMGELVYALEYRDTDVTLPFHSDAFQVPQDLYIIGTMNSSDRSIGHIDAAIRRRFGLMLVGPERSVVEKFWTNAGAANCGKTLADLMEKINVRLSNTEQGSEIGVGHSYFIADPAREEGGGRVDLYKQVERKWMFQVEPLLREYQQLTDVQHDMSSYGQEMRAALAHAPRGSAPKTEDRDGIADLQ